MNLLIISGPTGVGKTELSLKLAEKYNAEIISADSMQIYKEFNIGTAKYNVSNTSVPHHLIDIISADEEFSVYDFQQQAKQKIIEVNSRGKIPMIVGGTGLYINSLVYNLNFQTVEKDSEYRKTLEEIANTKGTDFLFSMLQSIDPVSAENIDKYNKRRLIRALEIAKLSKKEINRFREENTDYNLVYFALNIDRKKLYQQIDTRVDTMIAEGLIDEVKYLSNKYSIDLKPFNAIGYKEVISYLANEISLEEMIELIKKNSRHYAKRQLTWFRRDPRIIWLDKEDEKLLENVEKIIGEKFEQYSN